MLRKMGSIFQNYTMAVYITADNFVITNTMVAHYSVYVSSASFTRSSAVAYNDDIEISLSAYRHYNIINLHVYVGRQ